MMRGCSVIKYIQVGEASDYSTKAIGHLKATILCMRAYAIHQQPELRCFQESIEVFRVQGDVVCNEYVYKEIKRTTASLRRKIMKCNFPYHLN